MTTLSDRIARLDDYERGGADGEVDAFEEDLFERALAGDAAELTLRDRLVAGVRAMVERGTFEVFPSAKEVAALRARPDLRVAYFDLAADRRWQTEGADVADIVITRIALDVANVDRVDVEVGFEGGPVLKTMPDVSFDREDGAVYFCCEGELARRIHGRPFGRFWAVEEGRRRLLADITVRAGG